MSAHPAELAARLRRAADELLAGTDVGTRLALEADRYARDAAAILGRRGIELTPIAFVGPTGQGKTALLRLLVTGETGGRLRAGVRGADRTERVVWVGPERPADLDPAREDHVPCGAAELAELGRPYVLVDTPGFSRREGALARLADDALAHAPLHVLVVERSQIERADVLAQLDRSSGATVLPIVRARDLAEAGLAAELDAFHAALRQGAGDGTCLRPVVVPDADPDAASWDDVRRRLVDALRRALTALPSAEASASARVEARTRRLRRRVREVLAPVRARVQEALDELEGAATALPGEVVGAMLGSERVLTAGLRARLRVELGEATSPLWFPWRPALGLVQLTQGAWDRVLLAVAGSVPSWFGTVLAAGRELRDASRFARAHAELADRLTGACAERLGPRLDRFDRALRDATGGGARGAHAVRLTGLTELQETSSGLVDQVVARHAVAPWLANLAGLIGTATFWALLSGPIVALYRDYLAAGRAAWVDGGGLGAFPAPTLGLWTTSLALSLLPVLVLGLALVAAAVGPGRVRRAGAELRAAHLDAIARLQAEGLLRLEVPDPRLAEARWLLGL